MTAARRGLLIGGAAAAAAVAGATLGWRHLAASHANANAEALWRLEFDRPSGGGRLALGVFRGRPLLLNFWATWCPPCVAELPLLDGFYRESSGAARWQVVGLAVDSAAPVNGFLEKRPVGFPIGLAGLSGADLSRTLGNRDGALPFTVVFDSAGKQVAQKLGRVRQADLDVWRRDIR